jgi:DNA-binding NarL/FixJ family response regulator
MTSRQREVLQLLAEGLSMKKAGFVLGVTGRTVAFHKYRLKEAFGLKTNSDHFQLAMKHNLTFHHHALDSFSSRAAG